MLEPGGSSSAHQLFKNDWEGKFLFTEINGMARCLKCHKVLVHVKKYNLKRHYDSYHAKEFDKYNVERRAAHIFRLKARLKIQGGSCGCCYCLMLRSQNLHLPRKIEVQPVIKKEPQELHESSDALSVDSYLIDASACTENIKVEPDLIFYLEPKHEEET
ncbi:uncharacterized protein [Anabrus simplex]|uniref:uncharacterized protein n=1 Tax=Anabrus simplex TaxID=316456 RepID=UPI0034DD475C